MFCDEDDIPVEADHCFDDEEKGMYGETVSWDELHDTDAYTSKKRGRSKSRSRSRSRSRSPPAEPRSQQKKKKKKKRRVISDDSEVEHQAAPDNDALEMEIMADPGSDPSGGGGDSSYDEWISEDPDDTLYNDLDDEYTSTPNWCFFCDCTQNRAQMEANPYVVRCMQMWQLNYHNTDKRVLAVKCRDYYNKYLRPHIQRNREWKPSSQDLVMLPSMFPKHFEEHAPSVRFMQEVTLDTYNQMQMRLRKSGIFEVNRSTGKKRVHKGNAELYIKIEKEKKPLLDKVALLREHKVL